MYIMNSFTNVHYRKIALYRMGLFSPMKSLSCKIFAPDLPSSSRKFLNTDSLTFKIRGTRYCDDADLAVTYSHISPYCNMLLTRLLEVNASKISSIFYSFTHTRHSHSNIRWQMNCEGAMSGLSVILVPFQQNRREQEGKECNHIVIT